MQTLTRLGLLAVTASALTAGADSTWTGSVDTDLAKAGNWSAGIPTTGSAIFNAPIGSLTLANSMTISGAALYYNGNGAINLDLGAANTLTVGYRTFVRPSAVVTLKSGTYKHTGERFFVGDNESDGTFIVDGANAKLDCGELAKKGSNNYIEVGSANNGDSKDNLLKVQNGGSATGYVIVGRLANGVDRRQCGTNTLWVTGEGSHLEALNNDLLVGGQQGYSRFILDDKATATVNGNLALSKVMEGNGSVRVGAANYARIADGAVLTGKINIVVGQNGPSNLLEVVNGGSVNLAGNLYTSHEHRSNLTEDVRPHANTVRLSGPNTTFTIGQQLLIGNSADATDDALEVLDGASMLLNGQLSSLIGDKLGSRANRVLVDGGSINFWNSPVYVGQFGDCNTMTVTNGGMITCGNFVHVGCGGAKNMGGASNTVEVAAGGTFVVQVAVPAWLEQSGGRHQAGRQQALDSRFRSEVLDAGGLPHRPV